MRLINTKTLKLEFFTPSKIPPYAILSHTWSENSDDEVSFQDFHDLDKARTKAGFAKIEMTCKISLENGIKYAWVDTCCIDKSSSAELSESLNSMFKWYQESRVCFAYINDWEPQMKWEDLVPLEPNDLLTDSADETSSMDEDDGEESVKSSDDEYEDCQGRYWPNDEDSANVGGENKDDNFNAGEEGGHGTVESLDHEEDHVGSGGSDEEQAVEDVAIKCGLLSLVHHGSPITTGNTVNHTLQQPDEDSDPLKWFTRGWTLQELIAPREMEFYDSKWTLRGTKRQPGVVQHISRITGIPTDVLGIDSTHVLQKVCLGQRMSWAAHRKTTREEDVAYCLLGIFQVNMPMLYGEGGNAFFRLQEEILKYSTDLSIFAWTQHHQERKQKYRGILSRHPREFYRLKNCHLINTQFRSGVEFEMTNRGLRFNMSLFYSTRESSTPGVPDGDILELGCSINGKPLGIAFLKTSDFYLRSHSDKWIYLDGKTRRYRAVVFYAIRDFDYTAESKYVTNLAVGVKVKRKSHLKSHILKVIDAWPEGSFDIPKSVFIVSGLDTYTGIVTIAVEEKYEMFGRGPVAYFIVVIHKSNDCFAYLLEGESAREFTSRAESTSVLDCGAANAMLLWQTQNKNSVLSIS